MKLEISTSVAWSIHRLSRYINGRMGSTIGFLFMLSKHLYCLYHLSPEKGVLIKKQLISF